MKHRSLYRLSDERRRWWRAAMRPYRLDRAAWLMIADFERDLGRQMKALRDVLISEFSKPAARTTKRKVIAPQSRSPRSK